MTEPRLIARLAEGGRAFYALLEEDRIRELPGDPRRGFGSPEHSRSAADLRWLPPCTPTKIVCVGRNYRGHAAEMGSAVPVEPLLFMKPPSSLLPHGGVIRLPAGRGRVDFEGELAIVIGRPARRVPESRALDHVLGFTCLNDVTARDLQRRDVQFTRAKGFDTFCPVGPCIAAGVEPDSFILRTLVNGRQRQRSAVTDLVFGVSRLVSYISGIMTLEPGDLIATGTPEGVGPLAAGDEVVVEIEGIGRLMNRVEADGEGTEARD